MAFKNYQIEISHPDHATIYWGVVEDSPSKALSKAQFVYPHIIDYGNFRIVKEFNFNDSRKILIEELNSIANR